MAKWRRIYDTRVKKFLIATGILAPLLIGYFLYAASIGAITITGYSGDMQCAGTVEDPCYAYINFTANNDTFIYPTTEPGWMLETDIPLKDIKLQRSWGKGWTTINMTKGCTGSWCGCYWCTKTNTAKFSYAFRAGRSYQIRFIAYKENAFEDIKWSFTEAVDPVWMGVNIEYELLSNTDFCLSDCSLKFRFRINKSYTIDSLDKFRRVFKKVKGNVTLLEHGFRIGQIEKYNKSIWISNITCNPWNETTPNGTVEHPNCTDNSYWNLTEKLRRVYNDFNPLGKTIQADKWYYIELWGRRDYDFHEGGSVDAVPIFAGFEFPFSVWDSYPYRYEIISNATSAMPINVNDTGIPDIWTLNASASETKYLYCEVSNCWTTGTGNWTVGNETPVETAWENETGGGYDITGVWDDDYTTVFHMYNDTTTNIRDSSRRDENGTFGGNPQLNSSGLFGNAIQFDGNGDHITATFVDLDTGDVTVEAWVRTTAASGHIWSFYVSSPYLSINLNIYENQADFTVSASSPWFCAATGGPVVTDGKWHYLVGVKEGDEGRLYVDGAEVASDTGCVTVDMTGAVGAHIGERNDGSGDFTGLIDEFRLSNISRSDAYINETYWNGVNNLTALGAEEEAPVANTTPSVSLYNVSGSTSDNTPGIDFNFTDDDLRATCHLLLNGTGYGVNATTENATQTTITANDTLANDDYAVTASCWDGTNTGTSSSIILTVLNTTPTVNLYNVTGSTTDTTPGIDFNVTDDDLKFTCHLLLNGTGYGVNTSVENATWTTLIANDTLGGVQNEDYAVIIQCSDGIQIGNSSSIIMTVITNTTPSISLYNVTGSTGDATPGIAGNFTDDDLMAECYLLFNGTAYDYNASVVNATYTKFAANESLGDDDYGVILQCSDGTNVANSSPIILTVMVPASNISVNLTMTPFELNLSTGSFSFNYTDNTVYWYNATPNGQNGNGTFNVTERGDSASNINVSLNESPTTCMTFYLSNSSSWFDKLTLSTANQTIYVGLAAQASQMFHIWIDMVNCTANYTYPGEIVFDGWIP